MHKQTVTIAKDGEEKYAAYLCFDLPVNVTCKQKIKKMNYYNTRQLQSRILFLFKEYFDSIIHRKL